MSEKPDCQCGYCDALRIYDSIAQKRIEIYQLNKKIKELNEDIAALNEELIKKRGHK